MKIYLTKFVAFTVMHRMLSVGQHVLENCDPLIYF